MSSRVTKDYVRAKLPDGSFQPEDYVFGEGGRMGGPFRDASIDNLKFTEITRALAAPLASRGYLPAKKADAEKLLIMVYWGTTIVPDPRFVHEVSPNNAEQLYADNLMRNQIDVRNSMLLGYDSDVSVREGNSGHTGMAPDVHNDELLSELEDNRYFVLLLAFDFQAFRSEKKHKLLWETRFSINEAQNQFDKALPVMAQYAARYFGQDSHGLTRTKVPEGKVLMGEPRSLGEVDTPLK